MLQSYEKYPAKCPNCHCTNVAPSRWRRYEHLLWMFGGRPVRCRTCYHRFFNWSFFHESRRPASRAAAH